MTSYTDADLTAALLSYEQGEYDTIRACSNAYNIPTSTLYYRLNQRKSRKSAHENQQLLTSTEESTLVKWVSRLSKAGFPISLPLTLELAEEI
jgi:membrane-bound lytic murein transglycosylase MltF